MSGLAWIILDAVLALTAVFGVVKVAITPPPKPIPEAELAISEEEAKNAEKSVKEVPKSDLVVTPHADALAPKASLDDLWKETLFMPGRAEAEPGAAEEEAAAAAAALAGKNFEFELVGIAQISPTGQKATPVAILRSKQTNARNQRGRGPTGRNRNSNRDEKNSKTIPESKPAEKLVFKEGDPINATGYLIKAIYTDQKMVEVSRGSETIKLTINFAGEEANKRRDAVNQASEKKKQESAKEEQRQLSIREKQAREAEQRKADNQANRDVNPGTPPPPPGAMNGTSANGNGNADRQSADAGNRRQNQSESQVREKIQEQIRQRNNGRSADNAADDDAQKR